MLDHLSKFGGSRRPVVVILLRQRSSSIPLGHPKLIYHRHESKDRIAITLSFNARCCHQSWHVLVILAQLWILKFHLVFLPNVKGDAAVRWTSL